MKGMGRFKLMMEYRALIIEREDIALLVINDRRG